MGEIEKKDLNYSDELNELMRFIREKLSQELPTLNIDVDYFILGMFLEKRNSLYQRLSSCMITSTIEQFAATWYQAVSSKALTAVKKNRVPLIEAYLDKMLKNAQEEATSLNAKEVTSEHVFLAILNDKDEKNKVRKAFNKAGITYNIFKGKLSEPNKKQKKEKILDATMDIANSPDRTTVRVLNFSNPEEFTNFLESHNLLENGGELPDFLNKRKKNKNSNVEHFCSDLNNMAEMGKIDPLVGRDREINEIIRILGRKKKNNAILLGAEGVGKTAIGEALALKIVKKEVPEFLRNKRIVSLDMTALLAGTTLRGMFEERVKGVIEEVKEDGNIILFMDNIGAMLADKGKNDFEIGAMLSRALENGDVQVIGTSDFTSYRKTFDSDPSMARRFQKIIVEPSTISESIDILNGIKGSYEEYHKVRYTDDAINACVTLADRYISERNLPDSAIDVLDEIGASKSLIAETEELGKLRAKMEKVEKDIEKYKKEKNFEKVDKLSEESIKLSQKYNEGKKNRKYVTITKADIMDVVSAKTGIPVNNLTADDRERLLHMNERLKENVVGQDNAIDTICRALKRNRIGLHKNGCMYSTLMIGKSGVGKTLIAKKLAKELFGDEKNLVRFDMSEFSDKVAVNKLIGSNPGYVGYEEGGQLTETIKNKKHCVLLLDEIEKADPEIYNVFLQVLDEGFLTDNSGMRVDFKNVIVIFTSNIGTKAASEYGKGVGFNENEDENTKKILFKELKKKFPPEFINRIDNVIYFNSLSDDDLKKIIVIEMGKFNENLKAIGYTSTFDDKTVNYIFNIVKEEKEFGARPIMRAIQENIEDKVTDLLLENTYDEGYNFKITCQKEKIAVS